MRMRDFSWRSPAVCWPCPHLAADQERPPVLVFAAASLTNVLGELSPAWTQTSGVPVKLSFAASSVLARQIEAGGKADVFISADQEWMDYLQARNLIDKRTRRNLVGNRLVLIAPADSRIELEDRRRVSTSPARSAAAPVHRRSRHGARRALCALGAHVARRLGRDSGSPGARRQCAQRHDVRGARRSAAGHRLHHRRAGRFQGAHRRHLPGKHPRTDHLSRRRPSRARAARPRLSSNSWPAPRRVILGRSSDSWSSRNERSNSLARRDRRGAFRPGRAGPCRRCRPPGAGRGAARRHRGATRAARSPGQTARGPAGAARGADQTTRAAEGRCARASQGRDAGSSQGLVHQQPARPSPPPTAARRSRCAPTCSWMARCTASPRQAR